MVQKIFFVDHYDSFSRNLIVWLETVAEIRVEKILSYDDSVLLKKWSDDPLPIVLSPGPGNPKNLGPTLDLLDFASKKVPIFGVCLGHQMLGLKLGFEIKRSEYALHGIPKKIFEFEGSKKLCFKNKFDFSIPNLHVASYNSLVLHSALASCQESIQAIDEFGEIQVIESIDTKRRWLGWQFHPESFLSNCSFELGRLVNHWFANT